MGDLGKLIAAKGFKKLPKVQKIAQSGHTATMQSLGDRPPPPYESFFLSSRKNLPRFGATTSRCLRFSLAEISSRRTSTRPGRGTRRPTQESCRRRRSTSAVRQTSQPLAAPSNSRLWSEFLIRNFKN